jgi:hypothetical protein
MHRGSTVVCEQSLIVSVNMARRYPHESLALVKHLVRASETVQSPEARRALVWMLGQVRAHSHFHALEASTRTHIHQVRLYGGTNACRVRI